MCGILCTKDLDPTSPQAHASDALRPRFLHDEVLDNLCGRFLASSILAVALSCLVVLMRAAHTRSISTMGELQIPILRVG
jgi:hypothetical protein